jgi:hypothetical protein
MAGSGDDTTTTQTQTTTPWAGQEPYLRDIYGQASRQYDRLTPRNMVWQGPRYIDPTRMETNAMDGLARAARQGNPLTRGTLDQFRGMINRGGFAEGQRGALRPLERIAAGTREITTGDDYGGLFGRFGGDPVAEQSLMDTARGLNIGANNGHLMQALDAAATRAGDAVNSSMAGAGRYGSGVHQDVLGRTVGDIYARGLAESVQRDLDRQMAAAGQIDTTRQGYGGLQLSALGGRTNVEGTNLANQAGAAQSLNDIYGDASRTALQYSALAPQANEMRYADLERQLKLGAAQRAELQAENQANIDYFNERANAPFNALARYASLIYGSPSFETRTTQVPQGSPLLGAMGGATQGAQLGSLFGAPWLGAIGGGLLGAFG